VRCGTHTQVSLPEMPSAMPDPALRDAVLTACSARDDPRFLARIAFGIVSPRVMPIGREPVFRSMNVYDLYVCI
jgi:hypothetical protein